MANAYRGQHHPFPLSRYQKAVIDEVLNWQAGRNILVNAVAGSGKTATLQAVGKYLRPQYPGLFCAFNRHIAQELAGKLADTPLQVRTIHSVGLQGLRYAAKRAGIQTGQDYIDPSKYHRICKEALEQAISTGTVTRWSPDKHETKLGSLPVSVDGRIALDEDYPLQEIKKIVSLTRSKLVSWDRLNGDGESYLEDLSWDYGIELPESSLTEILWIVINAMSRGRASLFHTIDYTDMVWGPNALDLRLYQHPWVLVDECQDLSAAQLGIVKRSVWSKSGRLLFVGDRRQAIYGFAGAGTDSVDVILKETGAKELPLSICYRCPSSHVEMAQEIVPQIEAASWAEEGEVDDVKYSELSTILESGDIVLCRRTAPLISLCYGLIGEGIAAKVRGRAIGEQIAALMAKASPDYGFCWNLFPEYVDAWENKQKARALKRTGGDEDDPALETIEDQAAAMRYFWEQSEAGTLEGLQKEVLAVFSDESDSPEVWLSTVHRAKGLEADRVYILDYDHIRLRARTEWQQEQEANLEYIALTRARFALYFIEDDRE